MFLTDRLTITDKRRTADGYLVTTAKFARSGLYTYNGAEVGKPQMDKVTVYRPGDEVFTEDAMASFAHRPITNDHPQTNVDATNWKREAVGFTDGRVARHGDFVVVPMMVTDAEAIADVDAGKVELSAGYDCDLEFVDGTAPNGQKYDAIMRNIRGNHIAIVDRGRAGSECRIGDTQEELMNLRKITVDGLQVETTEAGEAAIAKLQQQVKDAETAAQTAQTAHDKALADKDAELAAKDQEIEDLKGKVLDPATLDQKVADRAKLIGDAQRLVPKFDGSGKSDAEIRRAVVAAKCGDAAVKDKSDAYVDARFDALLDAAPTEQPDALRDALLSGGTVNSLSASDAAAMEAKAREASVTDLNKWREPKTA